MKSVSLAALAAAFLISGSISALAADRGGVMTYGRYADSLFLDPVLNDANVDIWILSNIYDTLLLPTDDGQGVQAGLASEWSISDDGMVVTLKLRDGIKFSDGSPITAGDVKWSLERAAKPDNGIWGFLISAIASIASPDATTVVITLNRPDPAILPALSVFNTAILPQAAFEASAGTTDAEKAQSFSEKPIGSGPFILESWERGSMMKLVKNPHYWAMGDDGKPLPYLDGVTFEVIPDDATRILALQSGKLDGAEFIPYARVAELQADANLNMEMFPSTRIQYVTLNVRPQIDGVDNPLSNAKVRQALNYATNKEAIIQIITMGVGTPMKSFMSSATPMNAGTDQLYPYDLEKAKALMVEAGFPDGFSTTMHVLAGNQDETGIGTALQQMWAAIGVTLELQQVDNASRTESYRNGTFLSRISAWTDDIADPSEITAYFAYSPTIDSQHSGWKSEEADALFVASQSERDVAKRMEQYARIQEIHNADGPMVYLYETPYPVALKPSVKGFLQIPLGNNVFRSAYLEK